MSVRVYAFSMWNFFLHIFFLTYIVFSARFFYFAAFECKIIHKIAHFFLLLLFFSIQVYIVRCWVCVIRLWVRCDKPIQSKLFSSCHIEISFIVSYFSSGTTTTQTNANRCVCMCIGDRFFVFSIKMPSLFRKACFPLSSLSLWCFILQFYPSFCRKINQFDYCFMFRFSA